MGEKKVRFDEFELDFGRHQLSRRGIPVHLETIPLQLLMLLLENSRKLVTRDEIAASLWGEGVHVDAEQSINTAVRKVRKALDDDCAQPRYLQTIVGKGYRFVAETTASDGSEPEDKVMFSAEELGRAIMAAAGLDPNDPKPLSKIKDES